jgi:hypothetical protein
VGGDELIFQAIPTTRQPATSASDTPEEADTARKIAGRIIKQLCDRHEIVMS